MPVKAYVGLPRAGKSYEVVVNVIIPALRQGRRVVSNIAGLNYDQICQLFYREGIPQSQIGELVLIRHEQVEDPFFWRTDYDEENGTQTFIQPGDVVVLDEIWRFWKKRGDIDPRAMNFFRMHGHFPHPDTGFICEIALISQLIRDFNENIKGVVLETYQMVKNTKLGSDKSYIVFVYQQGSTSKADLIRTLPPRVYDQQYFPCYKSHSGHKEGDAQAVEKNPDDRGNVLKGIFFRFVIPLSVLMLLLSGWLLFRFFHRAPAPSAPASVASAASVPAPPVAPPKPQIADDWRVVGSYMANGILTATLVNAGGQLRMIANPPAYKISAAGLEVELPEGGFATPWTVLQKERVMP